MAEPINYQRIVLHISSPWAYAGETNHIWQCKFNLSGGTNLLATEMEPTALDLWEPIKLLSRSSGWLAGWRFYPIQGRAATGVMDYTSSQHPNTQGAYTSFQRQQQLEVCVLAHAPIGKSVTGKPVYLRKYIHGVQGSASDANTMDPVTVGTNATVLSKWNTGSGPRLLVPVDPTGGTQGGPWVFDTHLHTHQLRRGPKRKAATNTVYVPVPIP